VLIVAQVVQGINGRGGQRGVHLDGQLALVHIQARRQADSLGARALGAEHATCPDCIRGGVAVHRDRTLWPGSQGGLAGIRKTIRANGVEGQVHIGHVFHHDHPFGTGALPGRDGDRLGGIAFKRHAGGFQGGLDGLWTVGVVVDHRGQRHAVAHNEEARRDRASEQRERAHHVNGSIAHLGRSGEAARVYAPGRQVIRQGERDARPTGRIGHKVRRPQRRLSEVLTDGHFGLRWATPCHGHSCHFGHYHAIGHIHRAAEGRCRHG